MKTGNPPAALDAARLQAQEAAARFDAQFAALHAVADRLKRPMISASAIAMAMAAADAAYKAVSIDTDPGSERKIRSAIDQVDALAHRNPEAANVLMDMPLAGAYHLLPYIPAPARRPKGVSPETEDQLSRMDTLMEKGVARRDAANIAAQDHRTTADLKTRADYLVSLHKKR